MSVAPLPSAAENAVEPFVPRGLRTYLVHPDHVLLTALVLLGGIWLGHWLALAEGLGAVVAGSVLLGWLGELSGRRRYGAGWEAYRREVRWWWPRWKPWHPSVADQRVPAARVYFAETCMTCSAVARWVKARQPVGLEIHAAEDHPRRTLGRMSFDPMDGSGETNGMPGFGRVLQHLNLGYAVVGSLTQIPGLRWVIQVVVDALGGGPRVIARRVDRPGAGAGKV